MTDQQLLRAYLDRRAEPAFAELVRRHLDFVYSAALRMVRDSHSAEDVAQSVFLALAQNARQLVDCSVLPGWLHRTAQNLAANTVRAEVRRRHREQEAADMNELLSPDTDDLWERLAPRLDDALGQMNEADRDALLLRYFQRKSAREIGHALGTSEEAAQKRVNRAVERLREIFAKHGITVGAGALVLALTASAVQAAPAGLATTISSGVVLAAANFATTTATAAKTILMTTLQKAALTATLTAVVGAGIYQAHRASVYRTEARALREQQTPLTAQIDQLALERNTASNQLAALRAQNDQLRQSAADVLKLRAQVARLEKDATELARLKAELADDQSLHGAAAWKERLHRLKERLEQTPEARIPELKFLTDTDWLDAAKGNLDSDADYRRAFSALRSAGESKFIPMMQSALKGYMQANNQQFPTDLAQLQPYFAPPVDDALLQRWEIAPKDTVGSLGMGGDVIITEKAAVDDEYDTRYGLGPNGWGSTDFLSSETRKTMTDVISAYRTANNDQPVGDLSQLLPYATTPEQQAALQKMILRQKANSQ